MIDVEMSSSLPNQNKETASEKDLYMRMKELESELEMV